MPKCLIICLDFDGTVVDHDYPDIGTPVPGAIHWLKRFRELGAKIILWTMRHDSQDQGPVLTDAVNYLKANGVELWAVNENPQQKSWTASPKCYAHVYVDDAAACCPLKENPRMGGRPYVDWSVVGPAVEKMLTGGAA